MARRNILWLKELSKSDSGDVGEKAAYLGELYNQKLSVPNAFVISTAFYDNVLNEINEQANPLLSGVSDFDSAAAASNQLRRLISKFALTDELKETLLNNYKKLGQAEHYKDVPTKTLNLISAGSELPFVAVRASPTKPFPGLFKPVLNAHGIESLMNAIKKLLADMFSPRALLYYHNHDIDLSDFSISIIVQKMANSKKSGDLFSINPIKNSKEEMYVQAIWGIGGRYLDNPSISVFNKLAKEIVEERLVSHESYVTKNGQFGELISEPLPENVRKSAVLSRNELAVLYELSAKIEQIMNFPQHIEWVIERNNVHILQTQPITRIMSKPITTEHDTDVGVVVKGIPIVAKTRSGSVVFASHGPQDLSDSIVVADALDNSVLPQIIKLSGVLVSSSSLTSNAVFMCKEFDIPCIIGVAKAETYLKAGQSVEIASNGTVTPVVEDIIPPSPYSEPLMPDVGSAVLQPEGVSEEPSGIYQQFMQLERYITEQVSREAKRRASGENISEQDFKRAQLLSELEWQIRNLRQKLKEF